ncbi:MAG TPA: ethanolamine ammonia-lyase subunit EutC [Candidatus Angelobacter sp.]|nr:ethanolamine ammonia-lyase subunit EutC [Candidatus Angelobacter sp.]
MADELQPGWPDLIAKIKARTPARVLVDRAGAAYRTATQLELRHAHAAARDAVRTELDLEQDLGAELVNEFKLFEVSTLARSKDEYLLRPDLGRRLNEAGKRQILARCPEEADLQVVIGDGLSVTAVAVQAPRLLPLIMSGSKKRGWKSGQPFLVRYCRVGVLNDIGELLRPRVAVLLIGERPGLATAESLSAYMAYQPKHGDHDANRNLISNIHQRGVALDEAARRIGNLAEQMMNSKLSGVRLKEQTHRQITGDTGSEHQEIGPSKK